MNKVKVENMPKTKPKSELKNNFDAVLENKLDEPILSGGDKAKEFLNLSLAQINRSAYQSRRTFTEESLKELSLSIKQHGLLQPIVVRPLASGKYELVAGERRWRAAQLAGLHEIQARVRPLSDQDAFVFSMIENLQREDLNVVEKAQAMKRLLDEFHLTHEKIAHSLGVSRAAITNTIRLLNLVPEVLQMLEDNKLEMGHARAILAAPKEQQKELAILVVNEQMNVRQTERIVAGYVQKLKTGNANKKATKQDADTFNLCKSLSDNLGARVQIESLRNNKGRIIINYNSTDELQGILQRMGIGTEEI